MFYVASLNISDVYAFLLQLIQSLLRYGAVKLIAEHFQMGFSLSQQAFCARIVNMIRF